MLAGYVVHIPFHQSTKGILDDMGLHACMQLDFLVYSSRWEVCAVLLREEIIFFSTIAEWFMCTIRMREAQILFCQEGFQLLSLIITALWGQSVWWGRMAGPLGSRPRSVGCLAACTKWNGQRTVWGFTTQDIPVPWAGVHEVVVRRNVGLNHPHTESSL